MKKSALQIYLTPRQENALREAAATYDVSLAEVVRRLIDFQLVGEGEPPPTDLSDLAGAVDIGRPTNVAEDRDTMLAEALRGLR
jgi:hypothetical protein